MINLEYGFTLRRFEICINGTGGQDYKSFVKWGWECINLPMSGLGKKLFDWVGNGIGAPHPKSASLPTLL